MLPFQLVVPGWAGSQWWMAWRWRATDMVSPGLTHSIPWGLCPWPDPAPQGMSSGVPALQASWPTWYLSGSPCVLLPQYFSTCSLMYLALFLRSAKYTASHCLQQANRRTQTKENLFLISLTRPKEHLQHFPNLAMWGCTLHISLHHVPSWPILGAQALVTSPLLPWLTNESLLKSFLTAECVH